MTTHTKLNFQALLWIIPGCSRFICQTPLPLHTHPHMHPPPHTHTHTRTHPHTHIPKCTQKVLQSIAIAATVGTPTVNAKIPNTKFILKYIQSKSSHTFTHFSTTTLNTLLSSITLPKKSTNIPPQESSFLCSVTRSSAWIRSL